MLYFLFPGLLSLSVADPVHTRYNVLWCCLYTAVSIMHEHESKWRWWWWYIQKLDAVIQLQPSHWLAFFRSSITINATYFCISVCSILLLSDIAESHSAYCKGNMCYRSVVCPMCVCICMLSATLAHPAKAVGRNEMSFGRDTRVVPGNTVLDTDPGSPRKGEI